MVRGSSFGTTLPDGGKSSFIRGGVYVFQEKITDVATIHATVSGSVVGGVEKVIWEKRVFTWVNTMEILHNIELITKESLKEPVSRCY